MKLHIENFAKIANADIEINGITVIAGENNTGKSTVGKILYSLYSAFYNIDFKVKEERRKSVGTILSYSNKFRRELFDAFDDENSESQINEIIKKINDISQSNENDIEKFDLQVKYDLDDSNISALKKYLSFKEETLLSLVVEKYFETEFSSQFLSLSNENSMYIDLKIKDQHIKLSEIEDRHVMVEEYIDIKNECFYIDNPFVLDDLNNRFKFRKRHISERAMDMIFVRNESLKHADFLEIKLNKSLSKTSTNDLIGDALLTERLDEFKNKLLQLTQGDFLEKDNKFVFLESASNQEIELENLSTGIKALAIILKLIENHDISDNSMIVLDEPEIHLHPKWQIIFAEMLVLIQKEFNLNIVLTSHSPYFISAIEAYSAKYEIANKCKYYLSDLNEENMAVFEDVTRNTDKIYKKLAEPLKELEKIIYGNG